MISGMIPMSLGLSEGGAMLIQEIGGQFFQRRMAEQHRGWNVDAITLSQTDCEFGQSD